MRKPPTIHDVAGALGLHKSTVSLALSGKGNVSAATRQKVLAAARELGYEPNPLAQRLAHGHRNATVGIFSAVLDVGLATEKILLVQKALSGRSLEVPIYTCPEPAKEGGKSQAAQIRQLCRQRPRAILCAAQMLEPAVFRELHAYQREGGTVVSFDLPVPLECDQVIFDREENAYQAARHLLERGHRRIGIGMTVTSARLSGTAGDPQAYRLKGFRRALEEFGAPVREEWLFRTTTYEKGGAEMARQFLQLRERPTGLCIVNDYVALACMVELMRAGIRVPGDVSLVGHDDQPIASYCPVPLTAATQPTEAIARAVVDLLLDRIEGRSDAPPRTVTIRGELVQRESVAAPRSA
jgi:DNA-binding LacI/PurR family transcriptional regulator